MTTVHSIDPLRDPRWAAFGESHPRASVFHTTGSLEVLRRTHGYRPVVLSTFAPDQELRNGVVFRRVDSFLTRCRLFSVPLADHCEPLVDGPKDLEEFLRLMGELLYKHVG